MILKNIKLSNIRSYSYQEVEFPEGSILLSGDIGSGKSTILHAVEFALFGMIRNELTGPSLLRNGKNDGFVELCLRLNNKDIIIKRTLKRSKEGIKQTSGHLIINNTLTELTPVELKSRIMDLMGYPVSLASKSKPSIFRYTVYTPQEQMKNIIFDESEKRTESLRKIFGMDKYKRIKENCQIYIKHLKSQSRLFEGITSDLDLKKNESHENNHKLAGLNSKLENILPLLKKIIEEKELKQKELEDLENKLKELNNLKNKIEINRVKINNNKEIIQKTTQDIEKYSSEIKTLGEKINNLEFQNNDLNKGEINEKIRKREERINYIIQMKSNLSEKKELLENQKTEIHIELQKEHEINNSLDEKKEIMNSLNKNIGEKQFLEEKNEELTTSLMSISLKIKEIETKIIHSNEIKKKIESISECPVCLQYVSDDHKHSIKCTEDEKINLHDTELQEQKNLKNEFQNKLESIKNQLNSILENEKTITKLKTEISMMHSIKEEISKKRKLHETISLEINNINQALEKLDSVDIEKQKEQLDNEKEILDSIMQKEHLDGLIEEKKRTIESLSSSKESAATLIIGLSYENRSINSNIKDFNDVEDKYQTTKKEIGDIFEEEKKLQISQAALNQEIKSLKNYIESINQDIEKKNKAKSKLIKYNQIREWLETYFVNLMNTMEKQVMLRAYHEFNELFQKWFGMLVEQENINARLDDMFGPLIEQDGYEIDVSSLSGGEKTAVALAYRLALNKVVNDMTGSINTKGIIILDEPTDGFSAQQLDKLKEVIDELGMKQTIIVSHEEKIESFVDNIIKLNKVNHISVVSN